MRLLSRRIWKVSMPGGGRRWGFHVCVLCSLVAHGLLAAMVMAGIDFVSLDLSPRWSAYTVTLVGTPGLGGSGLPDALRAESGPIFSASPRQAPAQAVSRASAVSQAASVKIDNRVEKNQFSGKTVSSESVEINGSPVDAGGESAPAAEGRQNGIPRGEGGLGDGERPGIGVVDSLPVPVHRVSPGYPARARRKGVCGVVVLSCLVGVDGRPHAVTVLRSEPEGVFGGSAVAALKQWRFRPAMRDGRAVEYRIRIPFRFNIQ